jgi:hypothetical protein
LLVTAIILAAVLALLNRGGTRGDPPAVRGPTTLASTTQVGRTLLVPDQAPPQYQPVRYEFVMPEDQQRRLLRRAPELRRGDTVEQVLDRLGPPLRDQMLHPKNPKSDRPPVRELSYFFATRQLMGANNSDPCVCVFFDPQGRLDRVASNVPGIPSLNWFPGDKSMTPATVPSSRE